MIDQAFLARIRAAVVQRADAADLLAEYADARGRALLRERVRAAAGPAIDEKALDAVCADLFGFGALQPLLDDAAVTDVLVNAPDRIYVERDGRLELTDVVLADGDAITELAYRIAATVGRELTLEQPYVDARMRDGSRANAVVAPVGGPTLSIRKFRRLSIPLTGPAPSWGALSGAPAAALDQLAAAVREHANVLVSGATGSGKSTLLRSLAAEIAGDERLIVIEDTNELALPHPHVVHLECVPAREGGGVKVADLVANALRMRPDRILVGEVRTPREASALLEALSTGHAGALTTLHAGSCADALARLELLLARAGELSRDAIAEHVRRAIDVVVQVARGRDGVRRIVEIARVDAAGAHATWARA